MNAAHTSLHANAPSSRLTRIAQARQSVMLGGRAITPGWVERSWQRCLNSGLQPGSHVSFAQVTAPMLQNLARAIVNTRYFAILTNADGVVVDACGAIDHADPRAHLITRVVTDLSERSIGTTAIGTALSEMQPVWLHRGEHFFDQTSVDSRAGAALFAPMAAAWACSMSQGSMRRSARNASTWSCNRPARSRTP